jgi:hypothetical protein
VRGVKYILVIKNGSYHVGEQVVDGKESTVNMPITQPLFCGNLVIRKIFSGQKKSACVHGFCKSIHVKICRQNQDDGDSLTVGCGM